MEWDRPLPPLRPLVPGSKRQDYPGHEGLRIQLDKLAGLIAKSHDMRVLPHAYLLDLTRELAETQRHVQLFHTAAISARNTLTNAGPPSFNFGFGAAPPPQAPMPRPSFNRARL